MKYIFYFFFYQFLNKILLFKYFSNKRKFYITRVPIYEYEHSENSGCGTDGRTGNRRKVTLAFAFFANGNWKNQIGLAPEFVFPRRKMQLSSVASATQTKAEKTDENNKHRPPAFIQHSIPLLRQFETATLQFERPNTKRGIESSENANLTRI